MQREPTRATMKTQNYGWSDSYNIATCGILSYTRDTTPTRQALSNYRKERENGEKIDCPTRHFPGDGSYSDWILQRKDKDGTEWYRIKYTEGTGDRVWMEEKDRNYLARLKREEESKKAEKKATIENPPGVKMVSLTPTQTITSLNPTELLNIPDNYRCPITLLLIADPVNAPDGHTYEREAIEASLLKKSISPMTREAMTIKQLIPNRFAKDAIHQFIKNHREQLSVEEVYLPLAWQQAVIEAIVADDVVTLKRMLAYDPLERLLTTYLQQSQPLANEATHRKPRTALHWACEVNSTNTLRAVVAMLGDQLEHVLKQKQPDDLHSAGSQALLFAAAEQGNLEDMQLAWRLWADSFSVDAAGKTVLHIACQQGHHACVKAILSQSKSTINLMDIKGYTPIYYAVMGGHLKVVNLLLACESLNVTNFYGPSHSSILHIAFGLEHEYRLPILQGLLSHSPALVKTININGETVLHRAAEEGAMNVLKMLLQFKADPMIVTALGWNALHYAINGNHLPCVRYLVEDMNVDERVKTTGEELPIELATRFGYENIVQYFRQRLQPWGSEMLELRQELRELQQAFFTEKSERKKSDASLKQQIQENQQLKSRLDALHEEVQQILRTNEVERQSFAANLEQYKIIQNQRIVTQQQENKQLKSQLQAQHHATAILHSDFFKGKLAKWRLKLQDALVKECMKGNLTNIKRILAEGAQASLPNSAGVQPMVAAAGQLREEVVYYLENYITKSERKPLDVGLLRACYNAVSATETCPFAFKKGMKLSQFCQWVHENRRAFMLYVKKNDPELYKAFTEYEDANMGQRLETLKFRHHQKGDDRWKLFCRGDIGVKIIVSNKESVSQVGFFQEPVFSWKSSELKTHNKSEPLDGRWTSLQKCSSYKNDVEISFISGSNVHILASYAHSGGVYRQHNFDSPDMEPFMINLYDKTVEELIRRSKSVGSSIAKKRLQQHFKNYAPLVTPGEKKKASVIKGYK